MTLLDRLRQTIASQPDQSPWAVALPTRQVFGDTRPPVGTSPDLTRILGLPRRDPPNLKGVQGAALAELAVRQYARAPRACACASLGRECILRPTPLQGWALHEAAIADGLQGVMAVGSGKTFIVALAALAVPNVRKAVLLLPPGNREQLRREYFLYREHWRVPTFQGGDWHSIEPGTPVVHVIPYSQFSRPESTDLLERLEPDLVIADEAHCLRDPKTARTDRILRHWLRHRGTRMVALTGTPFAKSIRDWTHISAIVLKARSPLPLDPAVGEEWALALDPSYMPSPPGELERFGTPVRRGLSRRIRETEGVVVSTGSSVDVPLRILERVPPSVPVSVADALAKLRSHYLRPDGEQLVEDLEVAAYALQVSCGFFYRWRFPGIPETEEGDALIEDWFAKRKAWAAEVRDKLARRKDFMDSPGLVTRAAMRHHGDEPRNPRLPEWDAECWCDWRDVKGKVTPVMGDPVWIDDWLARDAAAWASDHRGVIWYAHGAFGAKVADLLNVPKHGGGKGAEERILAERGDRPVVASIKAHGTGRDGLQRLFAAQLVTSFPSSGQTVEQLLGRLHRTGQKAAEVVAYLYRHTPEVAKCYGSAIEKSEFIGDLLSGSQKLISAGVLTRGDGDLE